MQELMDEQRYFGLFDAYLGVSHIVQHIVLRDSRVEKTELHNSNISNLGQTYESSVGSKYLVSTSSSPNT